MNRRKRYIISNSIIMVIVLVLTLVGNSVALKWDSALAQYLGEIGGTSSDTAGSAYKNEDELLNDQMETTRQIVSEGTVLLKNDNALPLDKNAKVSVFGIASAGKSAGGSGSGEVKGETYDLFSTLEKEGMEINPTLKTFYENSSHVHGAGAGPGGGDAMGEWKIDEVPQSEYTQDVISSYEDYSDAALVVIGRRGGEGGDLPREMSRFGQSADRNYLELSEEEEELLKAIKESGKFGKTIVLINSAASMELGFVDQEEYGVDACLWYAGTGKNGIEAVAGILAGEINPSGRLVDTYVYDNFSAPATQNFGDFRYVDDKGELTGYSYVNYAEGIYVGYRYYETRYEDVVLGNDKSGAYDYDSVVKYPFGYGLSYSEFEWSDYSLKESDDGYAASVTVENVGDVAGKDVVQLYVQAPYTEGGVEKAAVVLAGYAKTQELQPGDKETVNIHFDKSDFASYDYENEKTWILDGGTYYAAVGKNAHDALNNILSQKGSTTADGMTEDGNTQFCQSFELNKKELLDTSATGATVTNQFDNDIAEDATYLSRSDWSMVEDGGLVYANGQKKDVSNVNDADGNAGTWTISEEVLNALENGGTDAADIEALQKENFPSKEDYTYEAEKTVTLVDLKGKDYDDPAWDELLNEMKNSEFHALFNNAGYGTTAIESIEKPKTFEYDGPAGISNMITGKGAFNYPSEVMLSATFNDELLEHMGELVGEDGIQTNTSGWYAPAVNIHRTPFSGRNYEYFSEDPLLSGNAGAAITRGVQSKGVYVYMKHFALNDQESNRAANGNVATWSNEQAIREIYLRPFQIGVQEGKAKGIMTSLNRIGTTLSTCNKKLLTDVARDEWGFEGIFVTDYFSSMDPATVDRYLAAGGNLILSTTSLKLTDAKENWCRAYLRESTHRTLYVIANSLAVSSLESGEEYKAGFPVYKLLLILLDIVVGVGILLTAYFTFRTLKMSEEEFAQRREKSKKRRMIIWSIVAALFIILVICFFIFLWPVLQTALLI